jgi:N6-L-threonylcarbamoyladenine synthase
VSERSGRPMRVLGIETSCDETAAAVVEDGHRVASDVVKSQVDLHRPYGGPVPEIASRSHLEVVLPVIEEALARAGIGAAEVDAIAVTNRPGLIGALLVGVAVAKGLALALSKPLVGVDHLAAHVYAAWLDHGAPPPLPFIALVVSGGHTVLYRHDTPFSGVEIGNTVDDAAGEAYDKVAALLGLGYPGGPILDALAKEGDPRAFAFKPPLLRRGELDFSFSGLKTAVRYRLTGENGGVPLPIDDGVRRDVAASFQRAVVDGLLTAAFDAATRCGARAIVIGGGCAANSEIRARFQAEADRRSLALYLPRPSRCTDNGAMIAGLGYHLLATRGADDLTLDARASNDDS